MKAGKLGSWEAGKLGSLKARKLKRQELFGNNFPPAFKPYSFLACQLNIKIESNDEHGYIPIPELAKGLI